MFFVFFTVGARAGRYTTAHGRLHLPIGAREDQTTVAKLSAETTGEQARG